MKLAQWMEPAEISVLLVEDVAGDAAAVTQALTREETLYNLEITRKDTLAEALLFLKGALRVDVVLLDLGLPDARELKAVTEIHTAHPDLPLVVVSGFSSIELVHQALKSGAQEFLVKGECSGVAIRQAIYQAIARKRIEQAYQKGEKL